MSTLDEFANAKLDQLAQAMAQRPSLDLTITGRLKPTADLERLQNRGLFE